MATGLIPNIKPMLLGATHYGYPFRWLSRLIIAPNYFPWRVDVLNLVADIIVWAIIVGVVLLILGKRKNDLVNASLEQPYPNANISRSSNSEFRGREESQYLT